MLHLASDVSWLRSSGIPLPWYTMHSLSQSLLDANKIIIGIKASPCSLDTRAAPLSDVKTTNVVASMPSRTSVDKMSPTAASSSRTASPYALPIEKCFFHHLSRCWPNSALFSALQQMALLGFFLFRTHVSRVAPDPMGPVKGVLPTEPLR